MNADVLATVLTGVGVLIGVWRIVTVQVDSVRRDLSAQIPTGSFHHGLLG